MGTAKSEEKTRGKDFENIDLFDGSTKKTSTLTLADIDSFAQFLSDLLKLKGEDGFHLMCDVLQKIAGGKNPIQMLGYYLPEPKPYIENSTIQESWNSPMDFSSLSSTDTKPVITWFPTFLPDVEMSHDKSEFYVNELSFRIKILGALSLLSNKKDLVKDDKVSTILNRVWQGSNPEKFLEENFKWIVSQTKLWLEKDEVSAIEFVMDSVSLIDPAFKKPNYSSPPAEPKDNKSFFSQSSSLPSSSSPSQPLNLSMILSRSRMTELPMNFFKSRLDSLPKPNPKKRKKPDSVIAGRGNKPPKIQKIDKKADEGSGLRLK